MTNELKFYDPETGKPLHRVPEGAMIPVGMPCGYIDSRRKRWWWAEGLAVDVVQRDYLPRFTREPIAPPLPTEPGYYLDKEDDLWELSGAKWYLMKTSLRSVGGSGSIDAEGFAPFSPVTLVPTETWDRLRALDSEDTRDRIDAGNTRWRWAEGAWRHVCEGHCRTAISSLEGLSDWYGPLRFADEVSGNE